MIIIIDYGMGNLRSVSKKLKKIGIESLITSNKEEIKKAEKLILPGGGHFKKAVYNLKELGLWDVLNEKVLIEKTPILGICLGMQLMAKHSEEGDVDGFGWFDANVVRFTVIDNLKYKIPHMGWNTIQMVNRSKLFKDVPENSEFYFVHSYHLQCNHACEVVNYTNYEYSFPSAIEKDNIFGVQYHPEKSHEYGEIILLNFARL